MSDFQNALTVFLKADPGHPVRTIVIALLIGALGSAILHLIRERKGWGVSGLMVKGFAAILMLIGGINFFLGVRWILA